MTQRGKKLTREGMAMNRSKLLALIFLPLGLAFLVYGVSDLLQVRAFASLAVEAEGTVIAMQEGATKYYPRVRFQTRHGQTVEFDAANGSNPPLYEVGERLPVLYLPDNPRYAVINTFIELWLGPLIYAAVGLLLLVTAWLDWLKSRMR
jgi:hypothetical protein